MKFRWLALFACLLVTACNGTSDESARVNPNKAVEKAVTPEVGTVTPAEPNSSEADFFAPADRFAANQAKYEAARQEFMTAYAAAANDEEKKSLAEEKLPKPEDYADEFMKLAADCPETDVAFDSLVWVASKVSSGEVADKAYDTLFADHLQDEGFKRVCTDLSYSEPSPKIETRLNLLIEKSPHDSVKAAATFALASYLSQLDTTRQYLADNPEFRGKASEETIKYLDEREVEPMAIEALYQTLISEYAELKPREGSKRTYKSMSESSLFALKKLAVGMVAPEIEGADLDGVTFKLSDYRGKVVVLDFWGDW